MIIYEVNLSISKAIENNFKKWLKNHAKLMLDFPGFLKFFIYEVQSEDTDVFNLSVHYYIKSESYLENYFTNYAEKMRQEGINLFNNEFTATRRVLTLCD